MTDAAFTEYVPTRATPKGVVHQPPNVVATRLAESMVRRAAAQHGLDVILCDVLPQIEREKGTERAVTAAHALYDTVLYLRALEAGAFAAAEKFIVAVKEIRDECGLPPFLALALDRGRPLFNVPADGWRGLGFQPLDMGGRR